MGVRIGSSDHRPIRPSISLEDSPARTSAIVELHIEELVLHGFRSGDRFHIGDALERELVRLLGKQDLPALLRQQSFVERLDAGTFKVTPGTKPRGIGAQLAQSVHQRLSSSRSPSPKTPTHAKDTRKGR